MTSPRPRTRLLPGSAGLLATLLLALAAAGAPPLVPVQLAYQGVLLDDLGQSRTGPVDLELRVYDAILGGTLLYLQELENVSLNDGVFSVVLGPAGTASDDPTDPLTTSLLEALSGDLPATGPARFLELTVGADPALPRTQLLASPYALMAAQAESAARAETADTFVEVGGLSADVITQIFDHVDLDGQAPPNNDPREGQLDTDGDGAQNFVDPDNDGDGFLDGQEVANGTGVNVVTPRVISVTPVAGLADLPFDAVLTGTSFDPAMTVQFGSESPTPQNVTPTRAELSLSGQPAGSVPLTVTLPNGETSPSISYFLAVLTPTITSLSPEQATENLPVTVQVTGTNFFPGMTVSFGSENPTPMNLTNTSFEVELAGQPGGIFGVVPVVVTLPNGESASSSFTFVDFLVHPLTVNSTVQLGLGSSGTDVVVSGLDAYALNLDANVDLEEVAFPSFTTATSNAPSQIAVTFDPSGILVGVRCVETGPTACDITLFRDADADLLLEAGEAVTVVESLTTWAGLRLWASTLRFDSLGRTVLGYHVRAPSAKARFARDLDGDGDFDGAGERLELGNGAGPSVSGVALDGSDRAAFVYQLASQSSVRVLHDRNGDGDFDDSVGGVSETRSIARPRKATCLGVAFDASDRLVVLHGDVVDPPTLLWDRSGDGDFDDAGESQSVGTSAPCDAAADASGRIALVVKDGDDLGYRIDLDDDGAFDGAGESVAARSDFVETVVNLEFDGDGVPRVASDGAVYELE